MQYQKVIEQLGYSPKEAKVYLASLKLGEAQVSDIAQAVNLPRSSVQLIVEKLHKDKLLNFYVMRRYKYWVAEDPRQLLKNFQKREAAMKDALPELTALRRQSRSRVKRDKQYQESIATFKLTADASHQPFLIANSDAEIEYVNEAWQTQFGYTLEEVQGENPRLFKSGKTDPEVYQQMWRALSADTLFQSDQVVDRRKDGTFFNMVTTIFPVHHGNRKFYIQILNNITEYQQAEQLREDIVATLVDKDTQT